MLRSHLPSNTIRDQRITQRIKLKLTDNNCFHASPFWLLAYIGANPKHILRLLQKCDTIYLYHLLPSRELLLT